MPIEIRPSVRAGPFRFTVQQGDVSRSTSRLRFLDPPRAFVIRSTMRGFSYQGSMIAARGQEVQTIGQIPPAQSTWVGNVEMVEVDSGDVLQMRDEKVGAILDEVNAKIHMARMAIVLPVTTIIVAFLAAFALFPGCMLLAILALPLWLMGIWADSYRRGDGPALRPVPDRETNRSNA